MADEIQSEAFAFIETLYANKDRGYHIDRCTPFVQEHFNIYTPVARILVHRWLDGKVIDPTGRRARGW